MHRRPSIRLVWALLLGVGAVGCGDEGAREPDARSHDAETRAGDGASADAADGTAPPFDRGEPDEARSLAALDERVSIVRDERGVPHVHARTLHDLAFAQGYAQARDRLLEMEALRRMGRGTLAELAGGLDDSVVEDDLRARLLGFGRVAEAQYDALEEGSLPKRLLDAHAAGVNAWIERLRDGDAELGDTYADLVDVSILEDWHPADALAIGRVLVDALSFDGRDEVRLTRATQQLREAFPRDADDPATALRSGVVRDVLLRFRPVTDAVQHPESASAARAAPGDRPPWATPANEPVARPDVPAPLLDRATGLGGSPLGRGGLSNAWAVGPERTASDRAILCNDPHLLMSNPPMLHLSRLVLEGSDEEAGVGPIDAFGAIFPGLPGLLLGTNGDVAWGFTTAGYDRTDVFLEEFRAATDDEPAAVKHEGEWKPVERTREEVRVGTLGEIERTVALDVLETPTGRVLVPELDAEGVPALETGEQLSYAWTGLRPTPEIRGLAHALVAEDVDELTEAFEDFHATNQTLVAADRDGRIGLVGLSGLPERAPGATTWDPDEAREGTAPWWILPGQGSADWEGLDDGGDGPRTTDPSSGRLVTANNDPIGQTLDDHPLNDARYLDYGFAPGLRAARIEALLDGSGAGSPVDDPNALDVETLQAIQQDTRSELAMRLKAPLLDELDRLVEEQAEPGTHPELSELAEAHAGRAAVIAEARDRLAAWEGRTPAALDAEGVAPAGEPRRRSVAATLWHLWLVELFDHALGDELAAAETSGMLQYTRVRALAHLIEGPAEELATYDAEAGESILWDDRDTPDERETRTETIAAAFVAALSQSDALFDGERPLGERVWGELHRLVLGSLLPLPGGSLDLPGPESPFAGEGFPRPGGAYAVNFCGTGLDDHDYACRGGPIVRLCMELRPGRPHASLTLPGGQSMDPGSPHYDDWLPGWLDGSPTRIPFAPDELAGRAEQHLLLGPGGD